MNDSKTYKISEDLFIAIVEHVYIKGVRNSYEGLKGKMYEGKPLDYNLADDKEAVMNALKTIRNQQYIYED